MTPAPMSAPRHERELEGRWRTLAISFATASSAVERRVGVMRPATDARANEYRCIIVYLCYIILHDNRAVELKSKALPRPPAFLAFVSAPESVRLLVCFTARRAFDARGEYFWDGRADYTSQRHGPQTRRFGAQCVGDDLIRKAASHEEIWTAPSRCSGRRSLHHERRASRR